MNWNKDSTDVHTLGGAGQRWSPSDYHYYERQWRTQQGAWGDPGETETRLEADVNAVREAFATKGTSAGLIVARSRGLLEPAKFYIGLRAKTEEELAVALAKTRAKLVKQPTLETKLREAFVLARLREVREAQSRSETPPQAVIDKPDLPRKHVPRWIPYVGIALSIFAFFRAARSRR